MKLYHSARKHHNQEHCQEVACCKDLRCHWTWIWFIRIELWDDLSKRVIHLNLLMTIVHLEHERMMWLNICMQKSRKKILKNLILERSRVSLMYIREGKYTGWPNLMMLSGSFFYWWLDTFRRGQCSYLRVCPLYLIV